MARPPRQTPRTYIWLGYLIVLATFGVAGGWAATARLDSGIIAPGTVSLEGNRRVIQHLEGGIVAAIHVREGERVMRGDVLLRMSTVQPRSTLDLLAQRHAVLAATESRLHAERDLMQHFTLPVAAPSPDTPEVAAAMADQRDLFDDRRALLASQVEIMEGRIGQLNAQAEGLQIQRGALERRIAIQSRLIERFRIGGEKGVIEPNILAQREDDFIQLETSLGSAMTEIARVGLAVTETRMQMLQIRQEYRERASAELREVRRERAEVEGRIKVARDVLARTEVRAPSAGTVQNVQVITAGSVIAPGMVLMEIVPDGEQLIITAAVAPQDIDSVTVGLVTEVKFSGLHDRVASLAFGIVRSVSRDVISPQNSAQTP